MQRLGAYGKCPVHVGSAALRSTMIPDYSQALWHRGGPPRSYELSSAFRY